MKKYIQYISTLSLFVFGAATLFMSSSVIFDWFDIRAKEGNYVPFVVWANWICAFIYIIAVYGFWKSKRWTSKLLSAGTVILIAAFVGLFIHINGGGIYEKKTVFAMMFRIGITLFYFLLAYFTIDKKIKNNHYER